jgi:predicted MFS family arabinose efflux permease
LISALLVIASFFCLKPLSNKPQPQLESKRIGLKEFFKTNPHAFLARFFLDFQVFLLLTFTVIFGVKIGLSEESSGFLISAFAVSGFFDILVGFALKKWNPYRLINLGFAGCLCCFLAIILFHNSYIFLLSLYFLYGIFVACIYVSVFKISNEDYEKEKLVAANSTLQLIGSSGSLFGSSIGGLLFNIFGTSGFPLTIILSCLCYLIFWVIYEKKSN